MTNPASYAQVPLRQRHRHNLLTVLHAALAAVNGRKVVREYLQAHPVQGNVCLIAVGKAAAAMTRGAFDALGDRIVRGLVITKSGHCDTHLLGALPVMCVEAGHPLPDERSLKAGATLVEFLQSAPPDARLLFLISGGASSLVEVLPLGLGLEELHRANAWLLASGLDIGRINRVRKSLSCIKGGRLAAYLRGRPALALLISDVPGDDPSMIGSGMLGPAGSPRGLDDIDLPDWLVAWTRLAPPAPVVGDPVFRGVQTKIVARLADARRAAASHARGLGYEVFLPEEFVAGDAAEAGRRLAREVAGSVPGLCIWGGETTVKLPPDPGRGGRNQSLALAAALEVAGRQDVLLAALGTDGTDGPTEDAGALVDGGTVSRMRLDGLDAARCLAAADAGTCLEASGDLIHTGPTGTNVMDLIIGLKYTA